MNDIRVTTEFCAEDRARIDRLIAALENATAPTAMTVTNTFIKAKDPAEKAPKAEPQANTQPQPEPAKEEAKPAPTATKADIRSKVVALVGAKKKAEVEAIIKAYAPSVTELPDDKLDEVMQKLTELEKGVKQ